MTKKFTLKNKALRGCLILFSLLSSSTGYTQTYCNAYSAYGCLYNNATSYGVIERVQISDISNNMLFNKAADGCNSGNVSTYNVSPNGYSLVTSKSAFTLSSGSKYTLGMSASMTSGATVYAYVQYVAMFIDLNRDGSFSTNEYMSIGWTGPNTSSSQRGVGGNIQNNTFTMPCGITPGVSRMRLMCAYSPAFNAGQGCVQGAPYTYGEIEDYTITLANPTSLAAGFFMQGTAYTGTVVKMTNSNQTGYISHDWDIDDDNSIEYKTTNATHIFSTPGKKYVRLKSQNCLGRDSVLKFVDVINPIAKPVVDFAVVANEIERYGTGEFLDLSTNGPTYWSWYMYDKSDSASTRIDVEFFNSNLVGNDPYKNQNPKVFFNKPGNYTVCMQASNTVGPSGILCKPNYLRVTAPKDNPLGAGTVQPIYEQTGSVMDDGGRNGNYSHNRIDYATIIPCGAETITLTFTQFKVATGDFLKIYDGQNAGGIPLHPDQGFTANNVPTKPVIAKSGAMYLYFSTNGSINDSGFIATWVTERGPVTAPVADFIIPDTLYNPVSYRYINTSQNVLGNTQWIWSIEPGYGEVGYLADLEYEILTDNTYDVSLEATTCMGYDKHTKSVVVVTPHTKAALEIAADNRRPSTGEIVNFMVRDPKQNKALKADQLRWSFFPNTVSFVGGTNATSREPRVTFNAKGKYTVSLSGWNTLDSQNTVNNIIRSDYVIVLEHCTPILGVSSSSDIAINNVILTDKNGVKLINNPSFNNLQGYDDYTLTNVAPAVLTFGATYTINVVRTTNINPMTRKIWVDWNIDGDFDDAGEMVASEGTAKTLAFISSFKVPKIANAFEGKTRMRIGTSYATDPNMPCGASSGLTNANRLGEFEDYRLILTNDMKPPVLTMNNDDTLYLEVGSTYTEYRATAIDPTEGDISPEVQITSDLDMGFTGIYYVTYNVSDAAGNAAVPITRVVYVVKDQNKPVITLNGSDTVYVEVFGNYNEDGATAMDNKDGNITNAIVINGTVNTNLLGTYILNYLVDDQAGNKASKKRVVIVKDSQKPVINNTDADIKNEIKVQILSIFIDRTKVVDNYDNPAPLVIINGPATPEGVDTRFKGTYTLIYNSTDASGNKAVTKTYKYIVDDYVGPTIVLNSLDTIIHPVNKTYSSVPASVYDNYYEISQLSITRTSNVVFYKLGLYYDEYTATDGSGNITVRRRYVRVIDDEAPVINGLPMNVGLWSVIDASEGLTIIDNYDAPAVLRPRLNVLFTNLNTYVEGLYAVTFELTDLSGNVSLPFNRIINVSKNYPSINGVGSVNTLGIDKSVNVYPNPSSGIINVSYNFATPEDMEVKVYNSTGALVSTISNIHGQSGIKSIDLSNEANGLYHVRMMVAGKQISRTISLIK